MFLLISFLLDFALMEAGEIHLQRSGKKSLPDTLFERLDVVPTQ
jgi:hypothetical protein